MEILIDRGDGSKPRRVTADLVFYAVDGDGVLYWHTYSLNPDGKTVARTGGGVRAADEWFEVEETVPANEPVADLWRSVQKKVAANPDEPPKI